MQLIQTVVLKQVLTESSRKRISEKYQDKMLQLKKECDQLQFEVKRLEKTNNFSPEALKKHFQKEMQMRQEKIKLLEFQMEQLHILPLGSEIKEGEVQAIKEIKVGDTWADGDGQPCIIIENGIVKEIR